MSRVITFSTHYQKSHPKAGQSTYFVEKIHKALDVISREPLKVNSGLGLLAYFNFAVYNECDPKYHTMRSGNRWKVGDKFSPRIWSGKPYASKQIVIGPDIEIKKIWDVRIEVGSWRGYGFPQVYSLFINGVHKSSTVWCYDDNKHYYGIVGRLAKNDGLTVTDLSDWFAFTKKKRVFAGQIICWSEEVEY